MVQDKINEKMLAARSTVHEAAGRLLEEQNLTKPEVEEFYKMFGTQCYFPKAVWHH